MNTGLVADRACRAAGKRVAGDVARPRERRPQRVPHQHRVVRGRYGAFGPVRDDERGLLGRVPANGIATQHAGMRIEAVAVKSSAFNREKCASTGIELIKSFGYSRDRATWAAKNIVSVAWAMSAVPYACGSPLPSGPAGRVPQCVSTLKPSLAVQPDAWLTAQRCDPDITSARALLSRKTPGACPAVRSNTGCGYLGVQNVKWERRGVKP